MVIILSMHLPHYPLLSHLGPVSLTSREARRRERVQVTGAVGDAPRRAAAPGSDPTEWECYGDHVKELWRPDSEFARNHSTPKHTVGRLHSRSYPASWQTSKPRHLTHHSRFKRVRL
ncbi:unnamed protein product [Schistocephalus solidus]|uniref:Secreted protein n=1 Tax=Schistocephalus solidus TaxID=70667 RepID=A0A183T8R1_SCHSO|nr:unnamed protein product [Schistocephalus solidus]